MRNFIVLLSLGLMLLSASIDVHACDRDTGARTQQVFLSCEGRSIKDWTAAAGHIETVLLPDGFRLGVQIDPTSVEKYSMLFRSAHYVPELVQITLFDMSAPQPRLLSSTWGGSNSIQGFSASGGAGQVDELGASGVALTLLSPVCVTEAGIAAGVKP